MPLGTPRLDAVAGKRIDGVLDRDVAGKIPCGTIDVPADQIVPEYAVQNAVQKIAGNDGILSLIQRQDKPRVIIEPPSVRSERSVTVR